MNFTSIDHPEHFCFHDSIWELMRREGDTVTFRISGLNIRKDTPLNDEDLDMELESPELTFRGFRLIRFEPGRPWGADEEGNPIPVGPRILYTGDEGMARLLGGDFQTYDYTFKPGRWEFGGTGREPYFTVEFTFDAMEITWDAFRKPAWYELHRGRSHEATLHTPEGEKQANIVIYVHLEDVRSRTGEIIPAPSVNASVTYNGKTYSAWGKDDYLWLDAIAALQKALPEGVTIEGCVNCRHGNFCPTGDCPNEVFCTRDLTITRKSDLFEPTEDPAQREKRFRRFFHVCADWNHQSEDFYTYSDYLELLRKEKEC